MDDKARAAYRRRLSDLARELEEAEGFNDVGRAGRARHEIVRTGAFCSYSAEAPLTLA